MAKEIVSVSLGPSSRDYEFLTQVFGEDVHVRRIGTDGNADRARDLVAQFDGRVDAIGLGGMALYFKVGRRTYVHQQVQHIAAAAHKTTVVDGVHLKETLERWAITRLAEQHRDLLRQKRIFLVSGIDRYGMAEVLDGLTPHLLFGDPIFHLNLPFALHSLDQLEKYARLVLPALCRAPYGSMCPTGLDQQLRTPRGVRYFDEADVIAGNFAYIRRFAPENLHGKLILTCNLSCADMEDLRARGATGVATLTMPFSQDRPDVAANVHEAILASFIDRPSSQITHDDFLDMVADSDAQPHLGALLGVAIDQPHEITDDDVLELVARCDVQPHLTVLNEPRPVSRFAFVIHPLTADQIYNHPVLKHFRFIPRRLMEYMIAYIRPLYVSRITGIRSPATGKEVEGFLITLGATPRELMRRDPGFTYRRLIVASRMAERMGAQIMGLGAFTKIVGDAGITVSKKADIAITSGNSMTVAATLEAAKQAVLKMGGRVDHGRAVIIGATGAIGAVCSRLLAQAVQDVVLVAPRPEKLIPLKLTIESETPGARVIIAKDCSPHLPSADLVVTTTSAFNEKVIDVTRLKPGCVVCDVARPPDVKEEDARLRPDVLVIESGEVLLPGEPDYGFDIGLPPGVAYACLAETAVLAMEDRFENFTLGRNIQMDRVKEIYRLFKKHGLQLEGLRSFGRYVTDEEIAQKRILADDLRQHPEKLEALLAQAAAAGPTSRGGDGAIRRALPWVAGSAAAAALGAVWLLSKHKNNN
jgi:predicted amino acid dehydrogenase